MTLKLFKWINSTKVFYFHVTEDLKIPQTCVKGQSIEKLKGTMSEFLRDSIFLNSNIIF